MHLEVSTVGKYRLLITDTHHRSTDAGDSNIDLWRDADPELQPRVEAARQLLQPKGPLNQLIERARRQTAEGGQK